MFLRHHKTILGFLLLLCTVTLSASSPASAADLEPPVQPADVVLDGKPVFQIRTRILSYGPDARAAASARKLQQIADDPSIKLASITVAPIDDSYDVLQGEQILTTITPKDAQAFATTPKQLAEAHAASIRAALAAYRMKHSTERLLIGAGEAVLVTIALVLAVALLRLVFRKIRQAIVRWGDNDSSPLHVRNRIATMGRRALAVLSVLSSLILLYIYLSIVFRFFPQTRHYADLLLQAVWHPVNDAWHAIVGYIPNLIIVVLVFVAAYYINAASRAIFREIGKATIRISSFYPEWAEPTYKLVRVFIFVLAVVIAYPYLPGANSPGFKGVSIFLGVLVSLGSTSAVASVIAGIILMYMRAFEVGHWVKIADTVGEVTEKNLLVTRVRTIKDEEVSISNATVLSNYITNYSSRAQGNGVIFHTNVSIGYDAPWRTVHSLLLGAAAATRYISQEPAPFVLQTALNDFYVSYELNVYTKHPAEMLNIYSELHQQIQDKFNEAGVEICSPHFAALRDGNAIAMPKQYVPTNYVKPGFEIAPGSPKSQSASTGKP